MSDSKTPARPKTKSAVLARIESSERKWVEAFKLGAILAQSIAGVVIVYFVMDGLQAIVISKPENIDALGRFVEKVRMGEAMGYVIAGVMGIAYHRERKGKKRLIGEKARLQRELEANDPARTSSGLDANGDNPEGEE